MHIYQADYLVHEELNEVHVAERTLRRLSCRPMSLTSYREVD
ncbi:Putative uncharacterized protein [Lactobacillus helveticus CIRM-BIA 101]|uniref:Uncharacterized protein n=2 Tax=Lactobacillus helveticus TaxID=1587 RepID=U4QCT6_LACHE|nr:Putative uncharacterized protein [Lactobacillus helveticus CIRM-BIA 953]CDI59458.1 Putative uncharacterized protein [Lactobacillus helveticus CIRM-BIA 104]CDI65283.1 Putative uncharacterized protein [Lactobacillus helveticus CIRM-BIA 101]